MKKVREIVTQSDMFRGIRGSILKSSTSNIHIHKKTIKNEEHTYLGSGNIERIDSIVTTINLLMATRGISHARGMTQAISNSLVLKTINTKMSPYQVVNQLKEKNIYHKKRISKLRSIDP